MTHPSNNEGDEQSHDRLGPTVLCPLPSAPCPATLHLETPPASSADSRDASLQTVPSLAKSPLDVTSLLRLQQQQEHQKQGLVAGVKRQQRAVPPQRQLQQQPREQQQQLQQQTGGCSSDGSEFRNQRPGRARPASRTSSQQHLSPQTASGPHSDVVLPSR